MCGAQPGSPTPRRDYRHAARLFGNLPGFLRTRIFARSAGRPQPRCPLQAGCCRATRFRAPYSPGLPYRLPLPALPSGVPFCIEAKNRRLRLARTVSRFGPPSALRTTGHHVAWAQAPGMVRRTGCMTLRGPSPEHQTSGYCSPLQAFVDRGIMWMFS